MVLSPREARFVQEFLVDLDGSAAIKRAGYKFTSAAAVGACKLLKVPKIAAAVAEGQRKLLEATEVTASAVLEELRQIAFADLSVLYNDDWSLRPATEWPEDLRKAVSSIDTTSGSVVRVRFHDKLSALGLLARHFQLLATPPSGGELVVRWAEGD